jgi:hypothetical protein
MRRRGRIKAGMPAIGDAIWTLPAVDKKEPMIVNRTLWAMRTATCEDTDRTPVWFVRDCASAPAAGQSRSSSTQGREQ